MKRTSRRKQAGANSGAAAAGGELGKAAYSNGLCPGRTGNRQMGTHFAGATAQ